MVLEKNKYACLLALIGCLQSLEFLQVAWNLWGKYIPAPCNLLFFKDLTCESSTYLLFLVLMFKIVFWFRFWFSIFIKSGTYLKTKQNKKQPPKKNPK